MIALLTLLFQYVGAFSSSSFILVAIGDFIESAIDLYITKFIAPRNTPASQHIVLYWSFVNDLWGDMRAFLDRVAVYSRPRQASAAPRTKPPEDS